MFVLRPGFSKLSTPNMSVLIYVVVREAGALPPIHAAQVSINEPPVWELLQGEKMAYRRPVSRKIHNLKPRNGLRRQVTGV